MKITSEYVKTFRSLQNRLRREFPITKEKGFEALPDNATEMLILGILATNDTYARARHAFKCLREQMVDFNELRVTPAVELAQSLEEHVADATKASMDIVKTLNVVFNRFDTLDLSYLKERSKTDLMKLFEGLPGCPDHGRSVMLLMCFDVPTMPLDDRMLEYLVEAEAMPAEADLATAKAFIERQIKASDIAAFYWQVKKATESDDKKRKPKTKKE